VGAAGPRWVAKKANRAINRTVVLFLPQKKPCGALQGFFYGELLRAQALKPPGMPFNEG
jgi:hypothetical protein